MPKAGTSFSATEYALVADRIALFYERFPQGRIITELVSRSEREVTFKASVYRSAEERQPAATGWASEREGDGDVNLVACLENTETSAIGRALANLGFTASRRRPSYEEMVKAERERALRAHAGAITDVLTLLAAAEREGMQAARVEAIRASLLAGKLPLATLERLERRIREWLAKRAAQRFTGNGVQSA
jgi:hypothetical protein